MTETTMTKLSVWDLEIIFTPLTNHKLWDLSYPFSFINKKDDELWGYQYSTADFCRGLVDEELCDPGNFPKNIRDYYWIQEGENDGKSWLCLCRLKNGCYVFYSASCDYTGFDCQGGMIMFISNSKERIFYECMDKITREACIKEKLYLDFSNNPFPVPPPETSGKNAKNPSAAFVRLWNDGQELYFNLHSINGLEMEAIEIALKKLTMCPPSDASTKKYYTINLMNNKMITDIDECFITKFCDPDRKWELPIQNYGGSLIRKWGRVDVSLILF